MTESQLLQAKVDREKATTKLLESLRDLVVDLRDLVRSAADDRPGSLRGLQDDARRRR